VAGKFLHLDILEPDEETVSAVSCVIKAGGTVIYPSDTVYGIIADSGNRAACQAVAAIKGYSSVRPFIVLVPDIESALTLVSTSGSVVLMRKYWPGPVTMVFKASRIVPDWLVSPGGTVALRQPADKLSQAILKETGRFLVTTSANRKAEPFPLTVESIQAEITLKTDITLDGGSLQSRRPSRILNCTGSIPVELRN